ncbi:hypothetical protein [Streptomyces sp. CAU 1734]|uniref:VG15 protein n=1 Tax=Streptomyces sp. CAU 1734 TaxID=3140360 RepID=UPI0032612F4B
MATPTEVQGLSAVDLAHAYYVAQAARSRQATDRVQALWRELDRRDLTGSWESYVGPAVVAAVTAGQFASAAAADAYVDSVVRADGGRPDAAGMIRPSAFAGAAADGRSLETLLYLPVITAKQGIAAGMSDVEAMMRGLERLLRMAATEVADAGRTATGAAIAGRRTIQGYIRVVSPPACARCIILAGKEFGWNRGFQRHPRCDCVHVPSTLIARSGGRRPGSVARESFTPTTRPGGRGFLDPREYWNSLSPREQDRIFTRDGAKAIRDGASIGSVVNARRGMYTAGPRGNREIATYSGTGRLSMYYHVARQRAYQDGTANPRYPRRFQLRAPRLMPEQIYRIARSRDEAIALLRQYAYIT